ncbi:hypothetical protein VPNG_06496 [Cytospora leucostoma]|uniref:Uncharacterized protein n=1 Tax=Cytospora leucostoma TaxID=1230097 RepID=A0A423X2J8_9PEZI|nr:hypothetical protein VPNG_06496 [Cytospora leucostoma]
MDHETPQTVQYAPSHQQNPDAETLQRSTNGSRPGSPTANEAAHLTKANLRLFDREMDVEQARRSGVPECDISMGSISATSSEEYRKVLEQVRRNTKPENEERAKAVQKYFEEYNAAHREEWDRQWKEKKDRENEEYERRNKAAVDEALERIRKVPYDQQPTLQEKDELPWADQEAWWIRYLEHRKEMYADEVGADDLEIAEQPTMYVAPSAPLSQGNRGHGTEDITEDNAQDHGHEYGVADTSHEPPEEDDIPEWAKDPNFIKLYGPYQPGFEFWIEKQERLAKEQEQRDQERREQRQREQEQKIQGQDQQGQLQEQQFVPLEHHKIPPSPSDHLRSLLPTNFPRFREVHGMNDMGAYLANASYTVSLGGPPSADLKYGIIIVPVGEESTLFGTQPSDVMTPSFIQEVYDSRYTRHAAAMADYHEASHDSAEFLRPRFASVDPDDRSLHSLDNLIDPGATVGPEQSHDINDEGNAISRHTKLAHAPPPTDDTSKAVNLDQTTDRLDTAQTVLYTGEA